MTQATISISYKIKEDELLQYIYIKPEKKRHLKYFMSNKYQAGRALEKALHYFYAGDGENILYQEEKIFDSVKIIKYKLENKIKPKFNNLEFTIFAELPQTEGCISCRFFKPQHKICTYYNKINIKVRKKCSAFEQSEK